MKKNTIISIFALIVLTACNSTPSPQGARVRPMPGMPMHQQDGQIPPPPAPGEQINGGYALNDSDEGEFLRSQGQNQSGYPTDSQNQQVNYPQSYNPNGSSPQFPNSNNQASNNMGMNQQPSFPSASGAQQIPPASGAGNNTMNNSANNQSGGAYVPPSNQQSTAAVIPESGGNAVKALLSDARKAVSENNLDRAASSLNRAVGLEPRNASIWYDLSQIRLHQGKNQEAEQHARKAISFAGNNQNIIKRSWQIIAASREARGDRAGAEQAKQQAL